MVARWFADLELRVAALVSGADEPIAAGTERLASVREAVSVLLKALLLTLVGDELLGVAAAVSDADEAVAARTEGLASGVGEAVLVVDDAGVFLRSQLLGVTAAVGNADETLAAGAEELAGDVREAVACDCGNSLAGFVLDEGTGLVTWSQDVL